MPSFHAPVFATQLLHIQPSDAQAPLSPEQQAFNQLLTQLEAARKQWQAWQDATDEVQTRYAQQVRPLWQQLWQAQADLAQQLDSMSSASMSKQDKLTLVDVIVRLSEPGAEQAPAGSLRDTLAELHTRYAPPAPQASTPPPAASAVQAPQAPAPDADAVDWDDPDAVAAYVEAQTQAAQAQAEQARASHQRQRQKQQAQRKAQAVQQQGKPSVRAVYRKLASLLHPDREMDPQVRAEKTVLMQRVNEAYAADDLLALLALQWEVEQLDTSRMAQLPQAQLLRYNEVLAQQLAQLQQATRDSEQALVDMLGLPPKQRHAAHKMPGLLRQYAQSLQQQVAHLQQAARHLLHHPDTLSAWLSAQR